MKNSGISAVPTEKRKTWGVKVILLTLLLATLLLPFGDAAFESSGGSHLMRFIDTLSDVEFLVESGGYLGRHVNITASYIVLFIVLLLWYKVSIRLIAWYFRMIYSAVPGFTLITGLIAAIIFTFAPPVFGFILLVMAIAFPLAYTGEALRIVETFFDFLLSHIESNMMIAGVMLSGLFILWFISKIRRGRGV